MTRQASRAARRVTRSSGKVVSAGGVIRPFSFLRRSGWLGATVIAASLTLTPPATAAPSTAAPSTAAPSTAAPSTAALCETAAARAAVATDVPLSILRAIALTETGRRLPESGEPLSPWPWAINEGGTGRWYATRAEAEARAAALVARGTVNFDVGCFQINRRWHGSRFASVSAMFEPDGNALYAAGLLRDLHAKSGDWMATAGEYHSATPVLAEAYLARLTAIHDRLSGAPPDLQGFDPDQPVPVIEVAARVNRFPLLRAGGRGRGASLFPAVAGGPRLIGGDE